MQPNPNFTGLGKDFWAHVRSLSQTLGYTQRGTKSIKVPTLLEIELTLNKLGLSTDHLLSENQPTPYADKLISYFEYRAKVLNTVVQHQLMDAPQAELMFNRLNEKFNLNLSFAMNKQKGEKKKVAYLTAMVNMLIHAHSQGIAFNADPRELTTITQKGKPIRTLSRRVDGAFPSTINPLAIWEIKEYYYTTTFGSRVADGVYETLLDGMELEELKAHTEINIEHLLIIDSRYTWWECGKAYLCRIIDMLHMGYVDEVLFGNEIEDSLPRIVESWVKKIKNNSAFTT